MEEAERRAMATSIEILAAIAFFTTGVSHLVQPRIWARFFVQLARHGEVGIFIIAFYTLPIGVLIVAFHNVWSGWPTVLTIIGWAFCLKSFIYFVAPKAGLAAISRIQETSAGKFVVAGIMMILLSGACAYWASVHLAA